MNPIYGNADFFFPDKKSNRYMWAPVKEWTLRYVSIQIMCAGRVVLDVGSKYGFGALFLENWAKKVIATDIENKLKVDVPFIQADWTKEVNINEKIDIINCMEVIEHVKEPEKVIKNCSRVLDKNGVLILTTPCVDRGLPKEVHIKPFFTKEELKELISPYFEIDFLEKHLNVSWLCIARRKCFG